jgi:hypothetical protein
MVYPSMPPFLFPLSVYQVFFPPVGIQDFQIPPYKPAYLAAPLALVIRSVTMGTQGDDILLHAEPALRARDYVRIWVRVCALAHDTATIAPPHGGFR